MSERCSISFLPCKIQKTGAAKISKRYWKPRVQPDSTKTVYFRGRRLRGRVVKLPESMDGNILKLSDKTMQDTVSNDVLDQADHEDPEPVAVVEKLSIFNELTFYGHDILPATEDSMITGLTEWLDLAEAIHKT
ncbi:hypothetical protein BT93_L1371 [Corymbia citriodora subsp. variegata]|uniref:Uncharacterized protein n=1 Tax=Corymbia citriodora subsp. variegata TaxID=360336 RepID=A0A8T0CI91_CORYI|nr:hypothetical protein BT93_L1371 [Corymbia citriodora subsp. variegata]